MHEAASRLHRSMHGVKILVLCLWTLVVAQPDVANSAARQAFVD